jgi:hypothetical protein
MLSEPPTGPAATSMIETVYVIDAEGSECLSCPDGVIPDDVRAIIAAANPEYSRRWIQSAFHLTDEELNRQMKSVHTSRLLSHLQMDDSRQIFFKGGGFRLHYASFRCRFWDCYKPRMWRIDDGGQRRWRRRVPHLNAPVRPFLVGNHILYIGGTAEGDMLVFVDVDTGKVVGHFLPEDDEFTDSSLLFDPAFFQDGYIYARGRSLNRHAESGRPENAVRTPSRIYVLKMNS